jgi:hypothetical protein
MPTDRAIDTFAQLTAFDPDRPNWRSWENRGYDRAGNVILIPKTPRRDDDGNIIFKKPKMGADGKPLPNQIPEPEKWDLDTAHPIHIDPTKHELLNKAITQRIRAGKSKAKQPEPTSIIGNLKKGAGALYTPKYKLDD